MAALSVAEMTSVLGSDVGKNYDASYYYVTKNDSTSNKTLIENNIDKMSDGVKKLFLKLAADSNLAAAIASNFDKLPEDVRNKLLIKLAGNKDASLGMDVVYGLSKNFKLPDNIRNKVQKRFAKHGYNIS